MTRSASDALSLTLPSRSKVRSRWKRPRKPSLWEAWFLLWTVISMVWSVQDLLRGEMISGIWLAGCAGFWWRGYQRLRRGHRFGFDALALGWTTGIGLALIAIGVPG